VPIVEVLGATIGFPDEMPLDQIQGVIKRDMQRAEHFANFVSRPEYYAPQGNPLAGATSALLATPIIGDIAGLAMDVDMYMNDPDSHNWFNYMFSAAGLLPVIPSRAQIGNAIDKVPEIKKRIDVRHFGADVPIRAKTMDVPAVRRREGFRQGESMHNQPEVERNLMNPEDFYGKVLVPVTGDKSLTDAVFQDVNGVPLSRPVTVEGGPGFPQHHSGSGAGWASMSGAASSK
jgi:hypothetical protein